MENGPCEKCVSQKKEKIEDGAFKEIIFNLIYFSNFAGKVYN